ncbi:MAG: exodeoxyribonuclease VII small subunit [Erysipelothrix sp.]|jgi:exodeoxyribonuclease VII small subunit|nr:exodeoxyribonuclease VII small subunit [Erysipelothrix sp.]
MENLTFEAAMARIQDIVSQLEKGEIPLQQVSELFEEGLQLLAFCEQQLSDFELKIKDLSQGSDVVSDETP